MTHQHHCVLLAVADVHGQVSVIVTNMELVSLLHCTKFSPCAAAMFPGNLRPCVSGVSGAIACHQNLILTKVLQRPLRCQKLVFPNYNAGIMSRGAAVVLNCTLKFQKVWLCRWGMHMHMQTIYCILIVSDAQAVHEMASALNVFLGW